MSCNCVWRSVRASVIVGGDGGGTGLGASRFEPVGEQEGARKDEVADLLADG